MWPMCKNCIAKRGCGARWIVPICLVVFVLLVICVGCGENEPAAVEDKCHHGSGMSNPWFEAVTFHRSPSGTQFQVSGTNWHTISNLANGVSLFTQKGRYVVKDGKITEAHKPFILKITCSHGVRFQRRLYIDSQGAMGAECCAFIVSYAHDWSVQEVRTRKEPMWYE